MRYFYEKPSKYAPIFGQIYSCEHPLYKKCTLFKSRQLGLAVIQQRFDPEKKIFWWGPIDPWLANDIFLHSRFEDYFICHSESCRDGIYPTITVRKLMWALRMKPLPKEYWETQF